MIHNNKEDVEELSSIEQKLHWIYYVYSYVFFGNGEYVIIPILWVLVFTASYLYMFTYFFFNVPLIIVYYIMIILELLVNMQFGFLLCKHHQLATLLQHLHRNCQIPLSSMISNLNYSLYFLVLCEGLCILGSVWNITWKSENVDDETTVGKSLEIITTVFYSITLFNTSAYLCIIWCFEVWTMKRAYKIHFDNILRIQDGKSAKNTLLNQLQQQQRQKKPLDTEQSIASLHVVQSPLISSSSSEVAVDTNNEHTLSALSEKTNPLTEQPLSDASHSLTHLHTQQQDELISVPIPTTQSSQSPQAAYFPQQVIEKEVFTFLQSMRDLSNFWYWNHIIRACTGFIITSVLCTYFYSLCFPASGSVSLSSIMLYGFFGIVYYCIIWFTALFPGIVNDFFFRYTLRKLSILYAEYPEQDDSIDRRIGQTMAKISIMKGVDGLHFGGMILSFEKALSVGSILASVILFCIHLNAYNSM